MKRPCPFCRRVIDDGLPCPAGITPEKMEKSHKICADCIPLAEAQVDAALAREKKTLDTLPK